MALDKQKILSDLGNVMNQLKSADCGCMGKLFNHGHQGQCNQMQGQCMPSQGYGGCCRRGYGHPCCGEPYTMGEGMPAHNRPCMSYCNAPKLYADGYNYMNQNVMQPVIKEVYDDLRSLNSGNAVSNNPLGAQMGLTPGAQPLPGGFEGNPNQNAQMGSMNANSGGQSMARGHPMMQYMQANHMSGGQQMQGNHGTGRRHVPPNHLGGQHMQTNHMTGGHQMQTNHMSGGQQMHGEQQIAGGTSGLSNFSKMFPGIMQGEGGGLSFNPMEIAMQMNPALAKQQPGMSAASNPTPGSGVAQAANPNAMQPGMNAANVAPNQMTPGYQAQQSPVQAMPNQQYTSNPASQPTNQVYAANTGNQLPPNFPPQGMNQNAQMARMNSNQGQGSGYGQHATGIAKFKEMFPGVMQGLEGDVNFDPMEIAIQMNPANKQSATMNSMQKLMTAKPLQPDSAVMQPVRNGMNAVNANFNQNQEAPVTQAQGQPEQVNQIQPNQQQYATNQQTQPNQQYAANQPPSNQQYATNPIPANAAANLATINNQPHQMQQPQVYTALIDSEGKEQLLPQGANAQQYQETPPEPMSEGYPNQAPRGRVREKEPILPVRVDNARYNTLGQPIELLPTRNYHVAQPNLPQTLSPQRVPSRLQTQSNNVKSTVSKTSLFARQPGRTPSRAQLQQVYNQYKGSQSYTDQNQLYNPAKGHTFSEGRLNASPPTAQRLQIPVEKVGGDTVANNQAHMEHVKGGAVGQVGDVANKPAAEKVDLMPVKSANLRNGLQDMVFTSYPRTSGWSFHGRCDQPRYRIRA